MAGYDGDLAPTICLLKVPTTKAKVGGQLKEHGPIGSAYIRARVKKGLKNKQQNVKYSDLRDSELSPSVKCFLSARRLASRNSWITIMRRRPRSLPKTQFAKPASRVILRAKAEQNRTILMCWENYRWKQGR